MPLIVDYEMNIDEHERVLRPKSIVKTRRSASVEYYQVVWHRMDSSIDCDLSSLDEYVTIEEKARFGQIYPNLVDTFNMEIESKKASRSEYCILNFFLIRLPNDA